MQPRWFARLGSLVSGALVCLTLAAPAFADGTGEAPLTADQQRRLQERDRFREEARQLQAQGKLTEAIAAADKAVAAARDVYGAEADPFADSLADLAALYEDHDDISAARKARADVLAVRLKVHGDKHWQTTDARLALAYAERLAQLEAGPRGRLAEARRLSVQVGAARNQGKLHEGLGLAERAAEIRKEVLGEKDLAYGASLNELALLHSRLGNFTRAEPLYQQAVNVFRLTLGERHPGYAVGISNQGRFYLSLQDFGLAEPLLVKALEISRETVGEKDPQYALCLNILGILRREQGNLAAAERLLLKSLAVHEEVLQGKDPGYGDALSNLAVLYQDLGDNVRAGDLLERAAKLARTVTFERTLGDAIRLSNLGVLCYNLGDYARSAALLREVVDIRKAALGDRDLDYADSLNNLGTVYERQGNLVEALRLYVEAASVYTAAMKANIQVMGKRGNAQYARLLSNLGSIFAQFGTMEGTANQDPAKAVPHYRQAAEYYEKAAAVQMKMLGDKHPNYARGLSAQAMVYLLLRDYDKAEAAYDRAAEIFRAALGEQHADYTQTRGNLGLLYYLKEDRKRAEPLLARCLESAGDQLRLAAAGQSERQQLAMLRATRSWLNDYLSLALTEKLAGDKAYCHVLTWKGAVFAEQRQTRLQRSQPELAGLFQDLRRTAIQLATVGLSAPGPDETERHAAWERQMADLTERKEQIERDLARKSAGFRREQSQRRLTPAQLQVALPPGMALVDFLEYTHIRPLASGELFSTEVRLVAFVVRHEGPIVQLDLGPVKPIAEAIGRWRAAWAREDGVEDPHASSATLRRLLWLPLEEHLKGNSTVLVSPDGVLGNLPLAALPGAGKGSYLLEDFAVAVVPVPQLLPELLTPDKPEGGHPPKERGQPSLLLVGDVNYDAEPGAAPTPASGTARTAPRGQRGLLRAGRLEGTRLELEKIGSCFQRSQRDPVITQLRGDDATESQVRKLAPAHRYLHFATHGFFAPANLQSGLEAAPRQSSDPTRLFPGGEELFAREGVVGFHPGLLSGLMLAGANKELLPDQDDGILTALEVAELDLRDSELAVLSACQTGLGKEIPGEGLLGLQRAFQAAGAHTVVGSLWSVDDKATQELMVDFYTNLWDKKMTRLEALRQAQLKMLRGRKWSEPNYWAPFVLSGDWR